MNERGKGQRRGKELGSELVDCDQNLLDFLALVPLLLLCSTPSQFWLLLYSQHFCLDLVLQQSKEERQGALHLHASLLFTFCTVVREHMSKCVPSRLLFNSVRVLTWSTSADSLASASPPYRSPQRELCLSSFSKRRLTLSLTWAA